MLLYAMLFYSILFFSFPFCRVSFNLLYSTPLYYIFSFYCCILYYIKFLFAIFYYILVFSVNFYYARLNTIKFSYMIYNIYIHIIDFQEYGSLHWPAKQETNTTFFGVFRESKLGFRSGWWIQTISLALYTCWLGFGQPQVTEDIRMLICSNTIRLSFPWCWWTGGWSIQ